MLINEHTKSAAEMIADFAATNQLATLVGTRTAGEVLGAVNFLVGEGYRLRIPIGGWMTWNDRMQRVRASRLTSRCVRQSLIYVRGRITLYDTLWSCSDLVKHSNLQPFG